MKQHPTGRTLAEFKPLTPAEVQLLDACKSGLPANLGDSRPSAESHANTVRADFLRFLVLGGSDEVPIHERGVQLRGGWVTGALDLTDATVPTSLALEHAHFEASLVLERTRVTGAFNLAGSQVPGLIADGLKCRDDVFLGDCFVATGKVRLLGAQIGGDLGCSGAKLDGKGDVALSADRAVINGGVFLNEGFTAIGKVCLLGAQIGGDLACNGAKLDGENGDALSAGKAVIKGSVYLNNGFTATGTVRLLSAQIGSVLECSGAKLDGKDGDALCADRAVIKGSVFLNNGFTATGKVRLLGAQIDGTLSCGGAKLNGKGGDALSAERAAIKGSVFLNNGFTATGKVRLLGAQIDGTLDCGGAKLDGKDGDALSAERAAIKGSVFLNNGFTTTSAVRLLGAQIGGNLACQGATFQSSKGLSFGADGLVVNGSFFFRKLTRPAHHVSLASARVGRLNDDADAWGDDVVLDGFVYEHIGGGAPTDATTRLAWLNKQPEDHLSAASFHPQPWRQLQQVLRNMGHTEDARQVAIALEDHLRATHLIGQTPKAWPGWKRDLYRSTAQGMHAAFGHLMGYGYRPMRLGVWMVCVWLVCAAVYWAAALQGVMGPSNPLVFQKYPCCKDNWYLCEDLPEEYTGFSPLMYSLDVLLPVVNLQQEQDWAPLIPTPKATWDEELLDHWTFKHVVRLFVWFEIMFGWVASLLLVAVLSGLTKRRDE
ncbi:hypothetical protein [Hydrogenophaga soli]